MGVKIIGAKEVFYDESNTTTTYEKNIDYFGNAQRFDINNTGAASVDIELNDDGVTRTVAAISGKGWTYKEEITKVIVTATDTFELLLRE